MPEDLTVKNLLASCHNNCGDVLRPRLRSEALRHFQQAVEIRGASIRLTYRK